MTATRIRITGDRARDVARAAAFALTRPTAAWVEVTAVDSLNPGDNCGHGCKVHALRRGCVTRFAVFHSRTYGCALGRDAATRVVPVSVAPQGK